MLGEPILITEHKFSKVKKTVLRQHEFGFSKTELIKLKGRWVTTGHEEFPTLPMGSRRRITDDFVSTVLHP